MKKIIKANTTKISDIDYYTDLFLTHAKATLTEVSVKDYTTSLDKFNRLINVVNISDINISTVDQYILNLKDENLSIATINHYLRGLRTFLNFLYKQEYIHHKVEVKMLQGQDEGFKCYSIDELKILTKKPNKNANFAEYRTYTIICFVLATGARAGTIRSIQMKDINFAEREIYYMHTKNKKFQTIPISNSLYKTLREYIALYRYEATNEDYLFCDVYNRQLSKTSLNNAIRRYNLAKGVNNTSIHAFRHTFARYYLLNGGDIFRLQKILGHKTLDMTRRYCNILAEDLKDNYSDNVILDNLNQNKAHVIK